MKFIDFFSGIGGFRLGMEQAGHKCVGHCEIDKYADMSYRIMHTVTEEQREYLMSLELGERQKEIRKEKYLNGEWYANDITRVKPEDLPDADCYCFGFPCQSFSIAGKRHGFEDTRGTLFFEVMRLAKERHPKVLFAENVKGLLNHDGGATFGTIIRTMDELGYDVEWQLLNSKHFGVPQNRERVFIVGRSRRESGRKVFPITSHDQETNELQGQQDVRTVNITRPDGKEQYQQDRIYDSGGVSPALNQGKSDLNIIARGSMQEHAAESADGICPTLTSAMGEGGGQTPIIANTIAARTGEAEQVGVYPTEDGRVLRVNGFHKEQRLDIKLRFPQGATAGYKTGVKKQDIAATIQARDYKGMSNQGINVVYEADTDNSRENG